MTSPRQSWLRWTLCIVAFVLVFAMGFLSTALLLISHEALANTWLESLSIFNSIGLFVYQGGGEEGINEALGNSLACLWFPLALLASWQLNRWLQRSKSWRSKA